MAWHGVAAVARAVVVLEGRCRRVGGCIRCSECECECTDLVALRGAPQCISDQNTELNLFLNISFFLFFYNLSLTGNEQNEMFLLRERDAVEQS